MKPLVLKPALGVPIYRQIMDQLREQVASGVLRPGDALPSIRELASALRINPASVVKAYGELAHLGVVVQDQGRGTFVSASVGATASSRARLLEEAAEGLVTRAQSWAFDEHEVLAAVRRAYEALGGRSSAPLPLEHRRTERPRERREKRMEKMR